MGTGNALDRHIHGMGGMNIVDALATDAILLDLKAQDKKGVLEELCEPIARIAGLSIEDVTRVLLERERLGSTGIGGGIGIPHGKLKHLDRLVLGFGLSRKGVDFESMDGKPTHLFFLLVTPESSTGMHLEVLAKISKVLKNTDLKNELMQAGSPGEVIDLIAKEDHEL